MRAAHTYLAAATGAAVSAVLLLHLTYARRRRRKGHEVRGNEVRVLRNEQEFDQVAKEVFEQFLHDEETWAEDSECAIGVDVEWVNGSMNPAAVLQISTGDQTLLLQLLQFTNVPACLERLMRNPRLLKVGVGLSEDMRRLGAWAHGHGAQLTCMGGIELVKLAKYCGSSGRGLASLAKELLGQQLAKGAVRTSNWEAATLSDEQITYAATDARASLHVFQALCRSRKDLGSTHDMSRLRSIAGVSTETASKRGQPSSTHRGGSHGEEGCDGPAIAPPLLKQPPAADKRAHSVARIPTRAAPVYDGWLMLDPNGKPMCRMARRRGEWYIGKGLARLLNEDDPLGAEAPGRTIQLNFEPNGPGNASEPWLLASKSNSCVGCGAEQTRQQVRFSVVPHAFRKLLPTRMKSRDSHDLVVLCVFCYKRVEGPYESRRAELFQEYGVRRSEARLEPTDAEMARVRSAALALVGHRDKLPVTRRATLEVTIAKALHIEPDELTPETLKALATSQRPRARCKPDFVPPEQQVVDAVLASAGGDPQAEEDALHDFTCAWRQCFIAALGRPRFLPEGWSTDHRRGEGVESALRMAARHHAAAADPSLVCECRLCTQSKRDEEAPRKAAMSPTYS